jgi:hypothetical protein
MKRKNLFVFLSRNKKERSGRNQEGIASVIFDTVFTVAHRGRGFCGGGAEGGGQESEATAKTEGKDEAD